MSWAGIFLTSLVSLLPWKSDAREVTLLFAGDAMQHQAQIDAARREGGKRYDYSACFSALTPYITEADYAVVNLETPLGGAPYTGYPCFSAPDEYLDALTAAGFDMMLTANNHTLDRVDRGLVRTLDRLDAKGVDHLGTYRNASERSHRLPLIREVGGIKIGFLNYTYGTNGFRPRTSAVVDYIERERIKSDIRLTRLGGAELIAVCIHWGEEYRLLPNAAQRSLADFLVDQGVDLVIGGHPHVIQPMEMRVGPSGRPALVVYSLGNFISNMRTRDTRGGVVVKATVARDSQGVPTVKSAVYRLIFTLPPTGTSGATSNFRIVPVVHPDSVSHLPAAWRTPCRDFAREAMRIFNAHNRSVGLDTPKLPKPVAPPLSPTPIPYLNLTQPTAPQWLR